VTLDDLKRSLTGIDREDVSHVGRWDLDARIAGHDWPSTAVTMVGTKRLDNLQECIESVLGNEVPGDLIETGVWRGGASLFMRAVLAAHDVTDRVVWVADSFQGMPEVEPEDHHTKWEYPELAVPIEVVQDNFRKYGMLDDQVRFLPGWFKDTLPGPVGTLAVLRLDGDYYSSTMTVLSVLYPKLSPGGFCIIDDYWAVAACKRAVDEYRDMHGVSEPMIAIPGAGPYGPLAAFWRRNRD
jgi:hypothetical protein